MSLPQPRPHGTALVTGASSGIGLAFARELSRRGHNTVLVARREAELRKLADELAEFGTHVDVLPCDLADGAARAQLTERLDALDRSVDVAVLCAGFGMRGSFASADPEQLTAMVRTNVEATMALAHITVQGMVARRSGAILVVASAAGLQPVPGFGAYAATKAAAVAFSEALSEEVRRYGVTVTALCPGPVRTEFNAVAGISDDETPGLLTIDAARCVDEGMKALERGRRVAVPHRGMRLMVRAGRWTPRRVLLAVSHRAMPGT